MAEVAAPTHQFDLVLLGGGTGGYVGGDPRQAARPECGRRRGIDPRRVLPASRLHSDEGVPEIRRPLRRCQARGRVRRRYRRRHHLQLPQRAEAVARRRRQPVQGTDVPLRQEAQDSGLHGSRQAAQQDHRRRDPQRRQRAVLDPGEEHHHQHRLPAARDQGHSVRRQDRDQLGPRRRAREAAGELHRSRRRRDRRRVGIGLSPLRDPDHARRQRRPAGRRGSPAGDGARASVARRWMSWSARARRRTTSTSPRTA